jgi:predicted CopG family antitoxin
MQKKLTITIDENIYHNLHTKIGRGKISKFIENLVKPYVKQNNLNQSYLKMSKNKKREEEALEWIEGVIESDFSK